MYKQESQVIFENMRSERARKVSEAKAIADAEAAKLEAAAAQVAADAAAAEAVRVAAEAKAAEAAKPAVESEGSEGKAKEVAFKAISVNEFGVIYGIGGAAGDPTNLDLDGEFMEKADLIRMAHSFSAKSDRKFKANHKGEIACDLVESFVGAPMIEDGSGGMRMLKAGERLTRDMSIAAINVQKGNETHWFVGVRPTDPDVVARSKRGEIAGLSWGAKVSKTEV